jgi:ribose transport system substrate-binding protein
VQAAKTTLSKLEQPVSQLTPNGAPFQAQPSAQGKKIGVVAGTTVVPLFHQVIDPFTQGAKLLGITVSVCDGMNFQAAAEIRCISQFINQKVNAIVLQSIDPHTVEGPLRQAKAAGILVIASNTSTENAPLAPNTNAQMSFPYLEAAHLEALSTVALSSGTAKPLVITSSDYVNSPAMVREITQTFAQSCGAQCKPIVRDVPIADWDTRLATLVQSTVQSNPNINYIVPLFDAEVTNVTAGLRAASAANRVKVVSFNGSQGIVNYLAQKDHPLVADVGTWPAQLGWATADAAARLFAGERNTEALRNAQIAVRIFDRTNINSLDLNQPNTWYGNYDLQSYYKKQWMLK